MSAFFKKYQFWFKCWGIVWGILATVFSFYMVTFFLGNHDWQFIRYDIPIGSGVWEARITQFIPPWLFSLGRMLPIWNTVFGFMFLSGAAVLLAKWYGLEPKMPQVVVFALLIGLHPYICTSLYYAYLFLSFGCWHFLTVLGLVFAWQFAHNHRFKHFIGALVCVCCALFGYSACIELIGVLVIGRLMLDCGAPLDKVFIKKWIIFLGCIFAILGIYSGSLRLLQYMDILAAWMYNTQTLPIAEIWSRLMTEWRTPFEVLNAEFPYVNQGASLFFWGLVLVFNLVLWRVARYFQYIVVLLLEVSIFYAAFAAAYISPSDIFYMFRVHAFSVPYLASVMVAFVLLRGEKFYRNIVYVIGIYLVCMFTLCDVNVQKVWYLGNTQDDKIVERIKGELLPQMEKNKHYRLSTLGNLYGQRKFAHKQYIGATHYGEYYNMPYFLDIFFSSGFFAYEPYNPIWGDSQYVPKGVIFYGTTNENIALREKVEANAFARYFGTNKDYLINSVRRLRAFPRRPYVVIDEKDIVLMLNDAAPKDLLVQSIIDN